MRGILRQFGTGDAEERTLLSEGPYPLVVLAGLLIFSCLAVVHVRANPTPDAPEPSRPVGRLSPGSAPASPYISCWPSPEGSSSPPPHSSGAPRAPSTHGARFVMPPTLSSSRSPPISCSPACFSSRCPPVFSPGGCDAA